METSHANQVELRNLQMEDYDQLARSFKRIYADSDVFWTHAQIKKLITIFPEGQVVVIVGDKIVGCALSIIVDYDMVKGDHTYAKVQLLAQFLAILIHTTCQTQTTIVGMYKHLDTI